MTAVCWTPAVSIIAEVDESRIMTRYTQGWVSAKTDSLAEALAMAKERMEKKEACAIAYLGNIVDLLEHLYEQNVHVDLALRGRPGYGCRRPQAGTGKGITFCTLYKNPTCLQVGFFDQKPILGLYL